jgi:TolB protein
MRNKMLLLSACCLLFSCYASGSVTVVKRATEVNPKMYYSGIKNDSSLNSYMASNLKKCGWFDVTSSSSGAKYIISGYKSSGQVVIVVRNTSTNREYKLGTTETSNKQALSYKLTDGILKKIFDIPGICNSKIAFNVQAGQNKDIFICNFDGSNAKRITNNKTLSIEPSWGLNNNLIVYTMYKHSYTDIVGKYLSTGKTYKLASFPGLNNAASVSPNGKYIAMILSRDRQVELYIKELRGQKAIRVTHDKAVEGSPCWSPDGRYICYVSDRGIGRPSLYTYDVTTKKISKIRISGSEAVTPDWSPLGDKIVYSARFGKQYTLAIYDVRKGVSQTVNINSAGDWMRPSWAPDGRHVVCARRLNYVSQLYIVDTWTGKARQLLKYKSNLTSPNWSALY